VLKWLENFGPTKKDVARVNTLGEFDTFLKAFQPAQKPANTMSAPAKTRQEYIRAEIQKFLKDKELLRQLEQGPGD